MNKLRKGLISLIVLPGLLAVSGCSNLLNIGGRDYRCSHKSPYYDSYIEKAEQIEEKLRENSSLKNKQEAVHAHGTLGNLNLMDKYVKEIIKEARVSEGELYGWIGEQYHKTHGNCKHEMNFLK